MSDKVASHYGGSGDLAAVIAQGLEGAGKNLDALTTADLSIVDEFHIGGRPATLKLAGRMNPDADCRVLDIGSGLGGPARTVAQSHGCHVTGVDLTPAFCDVAGLMSQWVGLA